MFRLEFLAGLLASVIAPHNGIVVRLASVIPANNSLPLISDPDSSQLPNLEPRVALNRIGHGDLDAQPDILHDLLRVVLEPPLRRRDLFVLNEVLAHQLALSGVDGELGGSGGLVQ